VTSTADQFSGQSFGSVGAYERLDGVFYGELDPKDPKNAVIQDIELAPVNERGLVEYSTDFWMLKPKDMSKASGVLRYDAPNRGNVLTSLNVTTSDSVYLERGYVMLYAGWQGDVPDGRLKAHVPVAINADGSPVTGAYRAELLPGSNGAAQMTLPGGAYNGQMIPYAPVSLDNTLPGYSLTKRFNETDPRIEIPNTDWKFATCNTTDNPFPGTPSETAICVKGGYTPDYIYEVVYEAKDPKVMGVGLAALRDFVSFLRLESADADGTANPLAGRVKHTLGQGTSQCGNAMKTFLHLGFNQRLDGGKVFDGIYSHVAARQTNINARFAVPGGGGGLRTDHSAFGQAAPRGLASDYYDAVSGRTGGVMKRCSASDTCPKFFLGLSGTEFWVLQGSPVLNDALGLTDLEQPDNARIYYYSSTQHGHSQRSSVSNPSANSLYPAGTEGGFEGTFRALFLDLEDWVVNGVEPPESQVPRIDNGTLARPEQLIFPVMKGVTFARNSTSAAVAVPDFNYRAWYNSFKLFDFGPRFNHQDDGGIADYLPPRFTGRSYAIMVPQVDRRTGMTLAGIKDPSAAAPTGTSLEFGYPNSQKIDLTGLNGSFIPFHKTTADRIAAGDTRPSLEELYGTQAGYVAAVTDAVNKLVSRRFLLQRDADLAIQRAIDNPILP
jgi:hypothetical protein